MAPKIGTQQAKIATKQRRLSHRAASVENTKADSVDITPVGMFRSELLIAENPRFLIMIPLNVIRPKSYPL